MWIVEAKTLHKSFSYYNNLFFIYLFIYEGYVQLYISIYRDDKEYKAKKKKIYEIKERDRKTLHTVHTALKTMSKLCKEAKQLTTGYENNQL